jgi:hypothetical protein
MKNFLKLLCILLSTNGICQTNSNSENWVFVTNGDDKMKVSISKDYSNVEDGIKLWVKYDYKKPFKRNDKLLTNVIAKYLWVIDCNRKRIRIIEARIYSDGKLVESKVMPKQWMDNAPRSIAEIVSQFVCHN